MLLRFGSDLPILVFVVMMISDLFLSMRRFFRLISHYLVIFVPVLMVRDMLNLAVDNLFAMSTEVNPSIFLAIKLFDLMRLIQFHLLRINSDVE